MDDWKRGIRCLRTLNGHSGPLQVVKWNSDGKYCLSSGQDKTVCLWNPFRDPIAGEDTGGYLLQTFRGQGYDIVDLDVSNDNTRLATVGGDKCAYIWDITTAKTLKKHFGHSQRLSCASWNVDGSLLFTGSYDTKVKVWDQRSSSRTAIETFEEARDNISGIVVLEDEIIVSSFDGCTRHYDLRMGRVYCDYMTDGLPISAMALSHDRNCVLVSVPKEGGALLLYERKPSTSAFSDPKTKYCDYGSSTQKLIQASSGTKQPGPMILNKYTGHENTKYRVQPQLLSNDECVITGSEDGSIYIWDLIDSKDRFRIPPRPSSSTMDRGRNSTTGASLTGNPFLRPGERGSSKSSISSECTAPNALSGHSRVVSCIAVHRSHDKTTFLSCSFDGLVKLWGTSSRP